MAEEDGFTLLEVLVALCIIAIAFGAIYRAQAQGIVMTHESREITRATLLAQQKMASAMAGLPSYGLRRGDFGDEYGGFSWEERVTGQSEFGVQLRRVRVSVSWGRADPARTLTLEGYVLEPGEEKEAEEPADGSRKPAENGKAGDHTKGGKS
ncbi:MAG: prepilin-type N-terminal cleavage/methylation domain-containing protein [Pseudomonadota bacterium]